MRAIFPSPRPRPKAGRACEGGRRTTDGTAIDHVKACSDRRGRLGPPREGEPVGSVMTTGGGLRPLPTALITRVGARVRDQLQRGEWLPTAADRRAAEEVLARLTAAVRVPRGSDEVQTPQLARRLQRTLRTVIHQVDDCSVTPLMAEVLTSVAHSLVPWHGSPTPPPAAAAPAYGKSFWSTGGVREQDGMVAAGEALRPHLVGLLQEIARPLPAGSRPRTPDAAAWFAHHEGRLVRHERGPGVWTAAPVSCPACGRRQGPWLLMSDWRLLELTCRCGASTTDHGLSLIRVCLTEGVLEALQDPGSVAAWVSRLS